MLYKIRLVCEPSGWHQGPRLMVFTIEAKDILRHLLSAYENSLAGDGETVIKLPISIHSRATLQESDQDIPRGSRGWMIAPRTISHDLFGPSLLAEDIPEVTLRCYPRIRSFSLSVLTSGKTPTRHNSAKMPISAIDLILADEYPELPILRLMPLIRYDASRNRFTYKGDRISPNHPFILEATWGKDVEREIIRFRNGLSYIPVRIIKDGGEIEDSNPSSPLRLACVPSGGEEGKSYLMILTIEDSKTLHRFLHKYDSFRSDDSSLTLPIAIHSRDILHEKNVDLPRGSTGWMIVPLGLLDGMLGPNLLPDDTSETVLHCDPLNDSVSFSVNTGEPNNTHFRSVELPLNSVRLILHQKDPEIPALSLMPLLRYNADRDVFILNGKEVWPPDISDNSPLTWGNDVEYAGDRVAAAIIAYEGERELVELIATSDAAKLRDTPSQFLKKIARHKAGKVSNAVEFPLMLVCQPFVTPVINGWRTKRDLWVLTIMDRDELILLQRAIREAGGRQYKFKEQAGDRVASIHSKVPKLIVHTDYKYCSIDMAAFRNAGIPIHKTGWFLVPPKFRGALHNCAFPRSEVSFYPRFQPGENDSFSLSTAYHFADKVLDTPPLLSCDFELMCRGIMPNFPDLRLLPLVKYHSDDSIVARFTLKGKPIDIDDINLDTMALTEEAHVAYFKNHAEKTGGVYIERSVRAAGVAYGISNGIRYSNPMRPDGSIDQSQWTVAATAAKDATADGAKHPRRKRTKACA